MIPSEHFAFEKIDNWFVYHILNLMQIISKDTQILQMQKQLAVKKK